MPTNIAEAFSLSHVSILDGATSAEDAALTVGTDLFGVRAASLAPDTGQFDNEGDDAVLSTWYWFNFATLTVTSGFISFPVWAAITGLPISSSGSGATAKFSMDLWNETMYNSAAKPVLIRVPSKDSAGAVRRIDIILYKVQFGPFTFDGPSYKAGLTASYDGRALASLTDELGAAFPDGKKRVGRIVMGAQI